MVEYPVSAIACDVATNGPLCRGLTFWIGILQPADLYPSGHNLQRMLTIGDLWPDFCLQSVPSQIICGMDLMLSRLAFFRLEELPSTLSQEPFFFSCRCLRFFCIFLSDLSIMANKKASSNMFSIATHVHCIPVQLDQNPNIREAGELFSLLWHLWLSWNFSI